MAWYLSKDEATMKEKNETKKIMTNHKCFQNAQLSKPKTLHHRRTTTVYRKSDPASMSISQSQYNWTQTWAKHHLAGRKGSQSRQCRQLGKQASPLFLYKPAIDGANFQINPWFDYSLSWYTPSRSGVKGNALWKLVVVMTHETRSG